MTLNTSDEEVIADRRHRAARLRLHGATQREIAHTLACSLGTVNGDLAVLRQEWRDVAAVDVAEHQARVLAELHEVRRIAWAQPAGKGLPIVLQSLRQECALLGLDMQPDALVLGDVEIILRWPGHERTTIDVTPTADRDTAAALPGAAGDSEEPGTLPDRVGWAPLWEE